MFGEGGVVIDMDALLHNYGMGQPPRLFPQDEQSMAGRLQGSVLLGDDVENWISGSFSSPQEQQEPRDAYIMPPPSSPQALFKFPSSPAPTQATSTASWQTASPFHGGFVSPQTDVVLNPIANVSPPQAFTNAWSMTEGIELGGGAIRGHTPSTSGGNSGDNDGRNRQSGGKGKGSREAEEKPVNRSHLTQRRYRERQKAKTIDLVNKVQQLQEENLALLEERTELLGRNSMLLQLLQQRDKQLSEANANSEPKSSFPAPSGGDDRHEDGNELAEAFSCSLKLTVREEAPIELGPDQIRKISNVELARLWRDYVSKLALLLVAADNRPNQSHLLERIGQLTNEAGCLITRVSLPNPVGVKNFVSRKLENDQSVLSREESLEAWVHAAASLGLSPEQQGQSRQLRTAYMDKVDGLLRQRQELLQGLLENLPSRLSTRKNAANFVKTTEIVGRLRKSMDEETAMVVDFIRVLYEQILTPMQRARYIVAAYPWTPDHLAFITAVAAQLGDSDAQFCLDQLHLANQVTSEPESSC